MPGKITSGINDDVSVQHIVQFVYGCLAEWRDDPKRPHEQAERKLNPSLSKFLDNQGREHAPMLHFSHEEPEGAHRSLDISVASHDNIYIPIMLIECKRLPAPDVAREKEYVTGFSEKSGGMQRFKLGLHAGAHASACMIGYIQNADSPQKWRKTINRWISKLSWDTKADGGIWSTSDQLDAIGVDRSRKVSRCRSQHERNGKTATFIILHHLWVVMD